MVNRPRHPVETCRAGQILPAPRIFRFLLLCFSQAPATATANIAQAQSSLVPRHFPHLTGAATKEKHMSIGSIGTTASLSQLYAVGQPQACPAMSVNVLAQSTPDTSTTGVSCSNALTGSTTASLDSQTLQGLMGLTQQDPSGSSDPGQAGATSQSGQTSQGVHHQHHHHGGWMQAHPPTDPSSSSSNAPGIASNTDVFGVTDTDSSGDSINASLTTALLSA